MRRAAADVRTAAEEGGFEVQKNTATAAQRTAAAEGGFEVQKKHGDGGTTDGGGGENHIRFSGRQIVGDGADGKTDGCSGGKSDRRKNDGAGGKLLATAQAELTTAAAGEG